MAKVKRAGANDGWMRMGGKREKTNVNDRQAKMDHCECVRLFYGSTRSTIIFQSVETTIKEKVQMH